MEYQFDDLGRLISAQTAEAGGWGRMYTFDGFGSLLQQNVTKGSAPQVNITVDPQTNRIASGFVYDAAGNIRNASQYYWRGYDYDSRLVQPPATLPVTGLERCACSERNERTEVTQRDGADFIHFHGVDGMELGVYQIKIWTPGGLQYTYPENLAAQERVWFGGRLVALGGERVATDRLGSVVRHGSTNYKYFPSGEVAGGSGSTGWDKPQFGTYTRDGNTGLDYARNRYPERAWVTLPLGTGKCMWRAIR